jgi:predicted transposase YdaD
MDSNLNNPHDKFVKEMFANREMAIEFLNTYLPDNLKEFLEIQSMEYSNTSFISP